MLEMQTDFALFKVRPERHDQVHDKPIVWQEPVLRPNANRREEVGAGEGSIGQFCKANSLR